MVASARAFCSSVWEHEGALRCAKKPKIFFKKNNNNKMMCTYACASMREASKARANALSPSAAVDECVWRASKRVRARTRAPATEWMEGGGGGGGEGGVVGRESRD